jgi:hypothetical protein
MRLQITWMSAWFCLVGCGGNTVEQVTVCEEGRVLEDGKCVADHGGSDSGGADGSGGDGASVGGEFSVGGSGSAEGGAGGAEDTTPPELENATPLPWRDNWLEADDNPFGIEGWVWMDTDCSSVTDEELECADVDESLLGPGAYGWSVTPDQICIKGVIEPIVDWSQQWGADLGFNFTPNGEPFDASELKGFAFDLSGTAPEEIGVVLSSPADDGDRRKQFPVSTQDGFILFDEALDGGTDPFDSSELLGLAFVAIGKAGEPTPYDFCLSNLRVLE